MSRIQYVLITALLLTIGTVAYAQNDSLKYRVFYPVSSSVFDLSYKDNASVLSSFETDFKALLNNKRVSDISVVARGNASVEGPYDASMQLAEDRAVSLSDFLVSNNIVSDSLIRVKPSLPVLVEALNAIKDIPDTAKGVNIPKIVELMKTVDGADLRHSFYSIEKYRDNTNWNWFVRNVLRPTRFCEILLYYTESPYVEEKPVETKADTVAIAPEVVPSVAPTEQTENVEIANSVIRLGTNLLYDVSTVANITFEAGFARHWSASILATFSPWDVKDNLKIRTLIFQPELRYYFKDKFERSYVGIEAHYGWYNAAFTGKVRYQDRNGSTPLWGAGVTYGYVLPFSSHWGMDFSIGAGYANLDYDCFYNVVNGAKFTSGRKDYFGPTKVGVSIYYQF